MLKVLKCVCVCVCEKPTCPARARGRCEGLQRASEATDGGNSWMGASSRSSMRGFLMFDSGLVRGVTLFLLIKVPGPLFTSCRVRNITFIIFFLQHFWLWWTVTHKSDTGCDIGRKFQFIKRYLWSVSVGVQRLHIQIHGLHFAPVGDRGELQHCVEGTLQVGHLIWNNQSKEKHRNEQSGIRLEYYNSLFRLWD